MRATRPLRQVELLTRPHEAAKRKPERATFERPTVTRASSETAPIRNGPEEMSPMPAHPAPGRLAPGQPLRRVLVTIGILLLIGAAMLAWWLTGVLHGKPGRVETMATRQFIQYLASDPETLTHLGMIDGRLIDVHSSRLAPRTQLELDRRSALVRRFRTELDRYDPDRLPSDQRLTWEIWRWWLDAEIAAAEPFYGAPLGLPYAISQFGLHYEFWNLMTHGHQLSNARLARNYISRLYAFDQAANETVDLFEAHAERGVLPPRSILERVIADLEGILATPAEQSDLVTSMRQRMEESGAFSPTAIDRFTTEATEAVRASTYPGVERMRDAARARLFESRTVNIGMGGLPGGDAYYRARLRQQTTVDLDPAALHNQALAEFHKVAEDFDQALVAMGLTEGSPAERFRALRAETSYRVAEGDEGRQELLAIANEWLEKARHHFQPYFGRFPRAAVEIRLAPDHSVNSAPSMYLLPAADGSRPGIFSFAIQDPADVSRAGLPRLVVHETIPGHHHQIALQQELGLPLIRRYLRFPGFTEGWGIYAEGFAREVGFYGEDDIAEVGVLFDQLQRAAILVIETGLHHEGWTREQALDLARLTWADAEDQHDGLIDRMLAQPGQIVSYFVGSEHIRTLRQWASERLGETFDIAGFHDELLGAGAMPLDLLEQRIHAWTESR